MIFPQLIALMEAIVKDFLLTLLLLFLLVDMTNFSSLEILDLSDNGFAGSISPYIGALSSNGLNGTLPTQGKNLV